MKLSLMFFLLFRPLFAENTGLTPVLNFETRGKWFDNSGSEGTYKAKYEFKTQSNRDVELHKKLIVQDKSGVDVMDEARVFLLVDEGSGFFEVREADEKIGSGYCTEDDRCHYSVRIEKDDSVVMMEETIIFGAGGRVETLGSVRQRRATTDSKIAYQGLARSSN